MPMLRDINLYLNRVIDSSYPRGIEGFWAAGGLFLVVSTTPMKHVIYRQPDPLSKELLDAIDILVSKGEATVEEAKEFIYDGMEENTIVDSLTDLQGSFPFPVNITPHKLALILGVGADDQVSQVLDVLKDKADLPRTLVCSPASCQRVLRPRIEPISEGDVKELHKLLEIMDVDTFLKQIGG
jgi:hypothetical protein